MRNLKFFALAALALLLSASCTTQFQTLIPGDTYHPYECTTFERLADGRTVYRCLYVSDQNPGYTLSVFQPTLPDTVSVSICDIVNFGLLVSQ